MSATKVLDQAEKLALLDARVIENLRKQVAESKFVVTPEALAKVLVDNGHLTAFQARKLVAEALGTEGPAEPAPPPAAAAPKPAPAARKLVDDELGFADEPGKQASAAVPPPPEEDILDLEAVPPPASKPAPRTAPARPAAAAPTSQPRPAPPRPAPKPVPADDDVIDLESAVPAPAGFKPVPPPAGLQPLAPAPVALQPLAPARPTLQPLPSAPAPTLQPIPPQAPAGLQPLPPRTVPALQPLAPQPQPPRPAPPGPSPFTPPPAGLAPLGAAPGGDMLSDPFGSPPGGFGPPPPGAPTPPKPKKGAGNRWDSPWLFIGGTALGLLVVALIILLLSMTRGNAGQIFAKAEEEYRSGSYTNAFVSFDKFVKNFPQDPNASLARIRRGMSRLRQASDSGKNPREALKIAKEVLPELLKEGETFGEARIELASILPDIADQFANQAKAAQDVKKRQELVLLTDEALAMVNLPDYIPPNLRTGQQGKIDAVVEKLLQARRTIDQEQDYATTLDKIKTLVRDGKVVEAYQVRTELLKRFPGLETQTDLIQATAAAALKEKELVQVVERTLAPTTDDPGEASQPTVLTSREGKAAPGVEGRQLAVLIQGGVYGVEATSGKALWRRFVGVESKTPPVTETNKPGADVFAVDARDHSLLRLEAATGKMKWRVAIGEAFSGPLLAGEKLYLATVGGQVVEVDAATGQGTRAAHLPQALATAPALATVNSRPTLFQMGKHSTLFVLAADTLACQETIYLAHKATGVAVPPVPVLGQLLILDNAGTDFSWIHIYSGGGEKGIRPVQESIRLKGRVVTPAGVYGKRVVIVTDLGEIIALEVDPSNPEKPVQIVGREVAREAQPRVGYQISNGQLLFVASGKLSRYEVQSSLQQLSQKWVQHVGDQFLAPLQLFGETLIHVRKQANAAGVTVEACNIANGNPYWSTQLATPMAGLSSDPSTGRITAISSRGTMFELASASGAAIEATWSPPAEPRLRLAQELAISPNAAVCLPYEGAKQGLVLSKGGGSPQVVDWVGDESAAAMPTPFRGGILVPLKSGRVQLLDATTGKPQVLPFMPTLEPGKQVEWMQPVVLPSQPTAFFIADQNRRLFRVGIKDQPQPHLAELAQSSVDVDLVSPLLGAGDLLYAAAAGEEGDILLAINPKTLTITQRWPQPARCTGGPWALGNTAVVSLDSGQLVCLEAGQIRWTSEATQLQPAAPPLLAGEDLLVATTSGQVQVVSLATGQVLATTSVGQPLGGVLTLSGRQLFIAGSDGVVHRIALPAKL